MSGPPGTRPRRLAGRRRRAHGGRARVLDGSVDLSAAERADELPDSDTRSREHPRVDADGSADDYWVCPDCRWIGERSALERDESGDDVCPVCRNASEYID